MLYCARISILLCNLMLNSYYLNFNKWSFQQKVRYLSELILHFVAILAVWSYNTNQGRNCMVSKNSHSSTISCAGFALWRLRNLTWLSFFRRLNLAWTSSNFSKVGKHEAFSTLNEVAKVNKERQKIFTLEKNCLLTFNYS